MDKSEKDALPVGFGRKLKLDSYGADVTGDAGLLTIRRIVSAIIMAAVVILLVNSFWFAIRHVFSGNFLASRFKLHSELVGDSYQAGIFRWLVLTLFLSAIAIPAVLTVRWLADRSGILGKWSFKLFSSVVFLFPLCSLVVAWHMLFQYIWSMGITIRRLLALGISGLIFMLLIITWAWSVELLKKKDQQDTSKPC